MAPLQPNNKCLTSVATGECMCVAKARADLRVGPGGPGLPFCPGIFFFRKRVSDVQYGIQAFAKFNLQNALDCISENLNLKNFPGRERPKLTKKCTVRSPDERYCAHIAIVYYISRPPLSQNPPSAPVKKRVLLNSTKFEPNTLFSLSFNSG